MRVAETRAVNRALRKAYGIGLCSVEELGNFRLKAGTVKQWQPAPLPVSRQRKRLLKRRSQASRSPSLLIRKYSLDAAQVKQYASEFCGTEVLRDASRDLVESFITMLEKQAANDRAALLCKLNSYPPAQPEVHQ